MTKKLLRVVTRTSTAVAILTQTGNGWTVERTAPILSWMRGLDMAAIKQRLVDIGATWEWLPVSEQFATIAAQTPQIATEKAARSSSATIVDAEIVHDPAVETWLIACRNAVKAEQRRLGMLRNKSRIGKRKTDDVQA